MKAISTVLVLLFLSGCAGTGMSGYGSRGDMGMSGPTGSADFNKGFDPNNPYHGG